MDYDQYLETSAKYWVDLLSKRPDFRLRNYLFPPEKLGNWGDYSATDISSFVARNPRSPLSFRLIDEILRVFGKCPYFLHINAEYLTMLRRQAESKYPAIS